MNRQIKKAIKKTLYTLPVSKGFLRENGRLSDVIATQSRHIEFLENELKRKDIRVYEMSGAQPSVRFITNQLDLTGAPVIFADLVEDFAHSYQDTPFEVHTFRPVNNECVQNMVKIGITPIVHDQHQVEFTFVPGDIVVMNTVAYTPEVKESIYKALEAGTIEKLLWYIHEDWPHIFFNESEQRRIRALIDKGRIHIYVPAKKALSSHQSLYAGTKNTHLLPYRFKLDKKYQIVRAPQGFKKLNFLMIGKTGEGLKGHLPILYALLDFQTNYFNKNPKLYRDFELTLIGIEADYLSLQILNHSPALGRHFKQYPPQPRDKTLRLIRESNVTICYSLRECLPVYVYEGMLMGHAILRNDVSGAEEQLIPNKNGYPLNSNDYHNIVETLEKILHKEKTTDKALSGMSQVSSQIAKKMENNTFSELFKEISKNPKK